MAIFNYTFLEKNVYIICFFQISLESGSKECQFVQKVPLPQSTNIFLLVFSTKFPPLFDVRYIIFVKLMTITYINFVVIVIIIELVSGSGYSFWSCCMLLHSLPCSQTIQFTSDEFISALKSNKQENSGSQPTTAKSQSKSSSEDTFYSLTAAGCKFIVIVIYAAEAGAAPFVCVRFLLWVLFWAMFPGVFFLDCLLVTRPDMSFKYLKTTLDSLIS